MSNQINNDNDLDLFSQIQSNSEIQTAPIEDPQVAFIHKCLHPPSAVPSFTGLPTNDARTQVLIQWRNLTLMNTPYIFDNSATPAAVRAVVPADLATFNYALLSINGTTTLSIPYIYNSAAGGMIQDFNNVDNQDLYDFKNWQNDANLYRPVYKSTTTYLNATAFNDTGTVAGSQFNPSLLFGGTLVDLATSHYPLFRYYMKHHVSSGSIHSFSSSHRDYIKHFSNFMSFPKFIRDDIVSSNGFTCEDEISFSHDCIYNIDPNLTLQIVNFNDVNATTFVPSLSQILTQSERSYGGRARDGTFTVQRLNTISPSWLSSSTTRYASPFYGLYQCYAFLVNDLGVGALQPFYSNAPIGTIGTDLPQYILLDTLWTKDMTWSWTLYAGLSLNSQTSVSTQLLIKKYYVGYEVQPALQSAWAGMVRLAPKPDLQSLQLVMDRFFELKDCMPARFNFLGGLVTALAPSLLSALPGLGKGIMKFFGSKVAKKTKNTSKTPTIKTAKQTLPSLMSNMNLNAQVLPPRRLRQNRKKKIVIQEKFVNNSRNRKRERAFVKRENNLLRRQPPPIPPRFRALENELPLPPRRRFSTRL